MDDLFCLVYASAARRPFSKRDLDDLLTRARAVNARLHVTGMLLHDTGSFFQVLEGPSDAVRALYEKISDDPRHHRCIKLIEEPIVKRAFADWKMAFPLVTRDELATIPGLNNFMSSSASYVSIGLGATRSLLAAFNAGRWRRALQD